FLGCGFYSPVSFAGGCVRCTIGTSRKWLITFTSYISMNFITSCFITVLRLPSSGKRGLDLVHPYWRCSCTRSCGCLVFCRLSVRKKILFKGESIGKY